MELPLGSIHQDVVPEGLSYTGVRLSSLRECLKYEQRVIAGHLRIKCPARIADD